MVKLTPKQIREALAGLPEWRKKGPAIERTYVFETFPAAIRFVQAVARTAERAGHHPDIDIRYHRVRLRLTTHDAGGLTDKDFDLARKCDRLTR